MFSMAELFLLMWALGATLIAVYYQHHLREANKFVFIAQRLFVGLIIGTAKIVKDKQGGASFVNHEDGELTDEIRVEVGQSESTNSP
jgi:hypothetical protein